MPFYPFWYGRFSDGFIWNDYLKKLAHLPILNFSFGGAKTEGNNNFYIKDFMDYIISFGRNIVTGSSRDYINNYVNNYLTNDSYINKSYYISNPEETLFILWIGFGLAYLDSLLQIDSYWLKAIIFVDGFIVINWFLSLPFSLYQTFKLDKKYGFSNITPALYIKDTIKSAFLTVVFGSLVIAVISYIILNFPSWWIFGFIFIFAVIVLINMLYPLIRDKMFDKFEKLKDVELEEKINALLKEVGFKSSGVFSVDASKRDSRLNAYFGGLGSTKRVVLFDTLIEKLTHNELLAVLGHELGHFKNGDILKNIGNNFINPKHIATNTSIF